MVIYLWPPPLKQKSINLWRTLKSLSCGNFVYKVEKSNVEIDLALFLLFKLVIASITGLLL